jgi:hypothetical protein
MLFIAFQCLGADILSKNPLTGELDWTYSGEVEHASHGGRFCDNGLCANGFGRATTLAEDNYSGIFVHGHVQGFGTYQNDYFDYVGGFKSGWFDGHGSLTCAFPNLPSYDRTYAGTFVQGEMKGLFKITKPGGPDTTKLYSGGSLGFAGPCE